MSECPYCHNKDQPVKAGKHESGSQRYLCKGCQRHYTPEPSQQYGDELRRQAVRLYADGLGFRQIGRHLGVDHVTVMHWVKAHTDQLPAAPLPQEIPLHIVQMDELYTFIGKKKKRVYVVTFVDRRTSCIVGWCVTAERDEITLQTLLDTTPQAVWYFSDLFATYKTLRYIPGTQTPMPDKSQTYRVEGMNAELRHYLKHLVRKTRCCSRCLQALARTLKLFVFAWNRRQLYRQRYPAYPTHLIDFVYP